MNYFALSKFDQITPVVYFLPYNLFLKIVNIHQVQFQCQMFQLQACEEQSSTI